MTVLQLSVYVLHCVTECSDLTMQTSSTATRTGPTPMSPTRDLARPPVERQDATCFTGQQNHAAKHAVGRPGRTVRTWLDLLPHARLQQRQVRNVSRRVERYSTAELTSVLLLEVHEGGQRSVCSSLQPVLLILRCCFHGQHDLYDRIG